MNVDLTSILTALIAALVGGGLTTGWVAIRKDRREEPIDVVRAVSAWRSEAAASAEQARLARTEMEDLRRRVGCLEDNEHTLVRWVVRLHAGIEDGSIPPIPAIPAVIADLLNPRGESARDT